MQRGAAFDPSSRPDFTRMLEFRMRKRKRGGGKRKREKQEGRTKQRVTRVGLVFKNIVHDIYRETSSLEGTLGSVFPSLSSSLSVSSHFLSPVVCIIQCSVKTGFLSQFSFFFPFLY